MRHPITWARGRGRLTAPSSTTASLRGSASPRSVLMGRRFARCPGTGRALTDEPEHRDRNATVMQPTAMAAPRPQCDCTAMQRLPSHCQCSRLSRTPTSRSTETAMRLSCSRLPWQHRDRNATALSCSDCHRVARGPLLQSCCCPLPAPPLPPPPAPMPWALERALLRRQQIKPRAHHDGGAGVVPPPSVWLAQSYTVRAVHARDHGRSRWQVATVAEDCRQEGCLPAE